MTTTIVREQTLLASYGDLQVTKYLASSCPS